MNENMSVTNIFLSSNDMKRNQRCRIKCMLSKAIGSDKYYKFQSPPQFIFVYYSQVIRFASRDILLPWYVFLTAFAYTETNQFEEFDSFCQDQTIIQLRKTIKRLSKAPRAFDIPYRRLLYYLSTTMTRRELRYLIKLGVC